jgi:hypothetical protein
MRAPQISSTTPTNGPMRSGKGMPDSGEAAGAKNVGKDELLDSFRKEDDEADEEPDEDRPS